MTPSRLLLLLLPLLLCSVTLGVPFFRRRDRVTEERSFRHIKWMAPTGASSKDVQRSLTLFWELEVNPFAQMLVYTATRIFGCARQTSREKRKECIMTLIVHFTGRALNGDKLSKMRGAYYKRLFQVPRSVRWTLKRLQTIKELPPPSYKEVKFNQGDAEVIFAREVSRLLHIRKSYKAKDVFVRTMYRMNRLPRSHHQLGDMDDVRAILDNDFERIITSFYHIVEVMYEDTLDRIKKWVPQSSSSSQVSPQDSPTSSGPSVDPHVIHMAKEVVYGLEQRIQKFVQWRSRCIQAIYPEKTYNEIADAQPSNLLSSRSSLTPQGRSLEGGEAMSGAGSTILEASGTRNLDGAPSGAKNPSSSSSSSSSHRPRSADVPSGLPRRRVSSRKEALNTQGSDATAERNEEGPSAVSAGLGIIRAALDLFVTPVTFTFPPLEGDAPQGTKNTTLAPPNQRVPPKQGVSLSDPESSSSKSPLKPSVHPSMSEAASTSTVPATTNPNIHQKGRPNNSKDLETPDHPASSELSSIQVRKSSLSSPSSSSSTHSTSGPSSSIRPGTPGQS
ncbi:hypothetical protein BJ684DRAFT_18211 [Piptocephalis cylindrospora]|uniref:Uncharacterized protein n=1 Tax=Piptocephalis cylindrospora TaxID=1907219 RepID=A0A4P9YAF1_9FUNG|nr:hypothetical protein BJ684DRAFT_18211 [Piptocephalis cylindrospora]|eukprot:RKP15471.1 hypothetical protein BJ684DRAFT_18211 [Piptocephalis cylindrospora]